MKPRIYLRALEPADYDVTVEWRNDSEIRSMVGGHSYFVSHEKEKEWVHNIIFHNDRIVLAICLLESNKHIGNVMMQQIDYIDGTAETAVMIGAKDEWGKGYGTEALFMMLKFAFEERRLHRIWALIKEDNLGSLKIHETCGFQKEGVLRKSIFRNGEYHNQVMMAVFREEFEIAHKNYIDKHS